jgi:hypothetical protein
MDDEQTANCGIVRFMSPEDYAGPDYGLSARASLIRELQELVSEEKPIEMGIAHWPKIQTAIRRGGLFVIETATPGFKATLRFNPQNEDAGDYEIHPRPRGQVQKGRTIKVAAVASDASNRRLAGVANFATRFAVTTVAELRPHRKLIWIIGLSSYATPDETEEDSAPA